MSKISELNSANLELFKINRGLQDVMYPPLKIGETADVIGGYGAVDSDATRPLGDYGTGTNTRDI